MDDFGNIEITHGYPDLGEYTIKVEATDDLGAITTDQRTASVSFPSGDLLGQYLFSEGNANDSSGLGEDGSVFRAANSTILTADRCGAAVPLPPSPH